MKDYAMKGFVFLASIFRRAIFVDETRRWMSWICFEQKIWNKNITGGGSVEMPDRTFRQTELRALNRFHFIGLRLLKRTLKI